MILDKKTSIMEFGGTLSSNFNSERGWWEKDLEPRRREKRKKLA